MAGERVLPGIGLTGFWNLGDNTWKNGMDNNLRLLSALVQPVVKSKQSAEPASPVDGDIYLATAAWGGGAANDIMVRDAAAWVAVTPSEGWKVYDQLANEELLFDGTAWVPANSASAATGLSVVYDPAADRVLSDADLAGNVVIERASATAQTVTINAGLTGTEPATVINSGGGALTFVAGAGVTILSANAKTAINTQYGSATIIPKGADTYYLVGALE